MASILILYYYLFDIDNQLIESLKVNKKNYNSEFLERMSYIF